MEESAAIAACDRIEAALARIDAALVPVAAGASAAADLQRRHELLREAAANALLAIDAMIATGEREPPA